MFSRASPDNVWIQETHPLSKIPGYATVYRYECSTSMDLAGDRDGSLNNEDVVDNAALSAKVAI
jgi:hypothetical protein